MTTISIEEEVEATTLMTIIEGSGMDQDNNYYDDQGWAVVSEIVLSTPHAKFHFFLALKSVVISF